MIIINLGLVCYIIHLCFINQPKLVLGQWEWSLFRIDGFADCE
jgi:hypothetical protein